MPYSVIDSPKKYFEAKTYTGTGATQSISGLSFKPDLTWLKIRNQAYDHAVQDAVRGATKDLETSSTDAEQTRSMLTAFTSDGFTLGTDSQSNSNGNTFVSWNWLGSNTTASNTNGTITSTVSANTTSGFSIVTFTYSSGSPTVGHGLGVAPSMVIVKNRTSTANNWLTYHKSMGATKAMYLNGTNAEVTSSVFWNNTAPTSSVFTVSTNLYAADHVAYCFAEVKGFSKFGSYTGNGSTDGTFIYTGFKPAFVMTKESSGTSHWIIHDTKRSPNNEMRKELYPNLTNAEAENLRYIDCLSNGFKIRSDDDTQINGSGATYIYMAFSENPFVSSKGIPTTAR